jgi:hypothetical protein
MARGAQHSAMPSTRVRQAERQARVWADGLVELHERIGPRFGRVKPRRRALRYLQGLLSQVERKNGSSVVNRVAGLGWLMALAAADRRPGRRPGSGRRRRRSAA